MTIRIFKNALLYSTAVLLSSASYTIIVTKQDISQYDGHSCRYIDMLSQADICLGGSRSLENIKLKKLQILVCLA